MNIQHQEEGRVLSSLPEKDLESAVSRAIVDTYHEKLFRALKSDVIVVGAGPSGLVASWLLSKAGYCVVLLEKRLSPGGGIWGGSTGMNDIVVEEETFSLLAEASVKQTQWGDLFTADAAELASALCLKAIQAGTTYLNLMTVEDLCVHEGRVTGVAANRSILVDKLPIDPMVFSARAVIDATGHEAILVNALYRRGLIESIKGRIPGEKAMDASQGEHFVVNRVAELFPNLWITGMSVCAALGGPRMGPIFGGMLLSGVQVAEQVGNALQTGGDADHDKI